MELTPEEHLEMARRMIPLAHAAGQAILRRYSEGFDVSYKADSSPVTQADREAEAVILEGLARQAPGIPVIAEEQAAGGRSPEIGSRFFLVDPLDGTKEFVKGNGEFTVNIGLVDNRRPIFGLIYAPAFGAMYVTLGEGYAAACHFSPEDGAPSLADFRQVKTRQPDPERLTALTSRSHQTEATREFISRHGIAALKHSGSSLKFCLIAEGEADVYPRLGPTWEWDTAAGHAILAAAGGEVVRADGQTFLYGKTETRFLNPGFIAWGRLPVPA